MSDYSEVCENFDKAARDAGEPGYYELHALLNVTHAVAVRNGFCAFIPPTGGKGDPWRCEVYASQRISATDEVSIREVYEAETLVKAAQAAYHDLQAKFRWQGTEAEARGDVW